MTASGAKGVFVKSVCKKINGFNDFGLFCIAIKARALFNGCARVFFNFPFALKNMFGDCMFFQFGVPANGAGFAYQMLFIGL